LGLKEYLFGFACEDRAAEFLRGEGFEILKRNFRCRFGEIDIVARKDGILHFVEVKATSGDYDAAERVTGAKMAKILKAVQFYLMSCDTDEPWQIDIVEVYPKQIKFIANISF